MGDIIYDTIIKIRIFFFEIIAGGGSDFMHTLQTLYIPVPLLHQLLMKIYQHAG